MRKAPKRGRRTDVVLLLSAAVLVLDYCSIEYEYRPFGTEYEYETDGTAEPDEFSPAELVVYGKQ